MLDDFSKKGAVLTLLEPPCGDLSSHYKVVVGKAYPVLEIMGSCYVIQSDDGEKVSLYHGRFEPIAY